MENRVSASPLLRPILDRWDDIRLPDAWLVAGAVAQTVWNEKLGFPPDYGIRDVDIVYFDGDDLRADSETREEQRVRSLFAGLPVAFDVKNEARVHLWYAAKFGRAIPPYRSTEDAIATFPTTATAIGVRPAEGRLEVTAPFGLTDLLGLVVRPNKAQVTQQVYDAKVTRWRDLWPGLDIRPWDED